MFTVIDSCCVLFCVVGTLTNMAKCALFVPKLRFHVTYLRNLKKKKKKKNSRVEAHSQKDQKGSPVVIQNYFGCIRNLNLILQFS